MSVFLVSPCSLFFFASLLSCVEDSVILLFRLGATPPPRAPCEPEVCVFPLRAVFFLALLMLTYLYFFLLFLPFFDFDLDIVCFHPVFFLWVLCCLLGFGFCCDSFSIWYVSWYVRTLISPFYFCLRYTICFSYCVYYLLFLFVFLLR